jgi:tRNA(adenine34) deaminase
MKTHEFFMEEAIKQAKLAGQRGEVPIGAVLVLDGKIIGSGSQRVEEDKFIGRHAEMIAIETGSKSINNWRLNDSILYTTLEPCPMCMSAIVLSRVKAVYFGAFDKRLGAGGSQYNLAELPSLPHNPHIYGGVLIDECSALLTEFFKEIR